MCAFKIKNVIVSCRTSNIIIIKDKYNSQLYKSGIEKNSVYTNIDCKKNKIFFLNVVKF